MYTQITFNRATVSILSTHVESYPALLNLEQLPGDMAHITPTQLLLALSIAVVPIIPFASYRSHRDLFYAIKMAQYIGVPDDVIFTSTFSTTTNPCYTRLTDAHFMYPLATISDSLANFRAYFVASKSPEIAFQSIAGKPLIDSAIAFGAAEFYSNFVFEDCFEENTPAVQKRLRMLEAARCNNNLLINPHSSMFAPMMISFPVMPHDIWSCKGISVVDVSPAGESSAAQPEEAYRRLVEFTCGQLPDPANPMQSAAGVVKTVEFPVKNVVIAGGSISKIIAAKYNPKNARQSDCDLFIIGKTYDERAKAFQAVIDWFKDGQEKDSVYYALRGSVVTIYIKNVPRKFQLISIDRTSAFGVISRFDMTHIQWCVYDWEFLGTTGAITTLNSRITYMRNTHKLRIERLIKALHCGYSIKRDEKTAEIDISTLVDNPTGEATQKYIRALYGYYYPTTMVGLDADEEKLYIENMVEKDAASDHITTDPQFVINNVTIGGSFDSDYHSISYTTFNPAVVCNHPPGRRTFMTLQSKQGNIGLTSPIMTIVGLEKTEHTMAISCSVLEQGFADFVHNIEDGVMKIYKPAGVATRAIRDGVIVFTVSLRRAKYMIKTRRGAPATVDDLAVGDEIQVAFSIALVFGDDAHVELPPYRIVKQANVVATAPPAAEPVMAPATEAVAYEDF